MSNRAFTRVVQRCGPVPCDCPADKREEEELRLQSMGTWSAPTVHRLEACDSSGGGCIEVADEADLPPGYVVPPAATTVPDPPAADTATQDDSSPPVQVPAAMATGVATEDGGPYHPPTGVPLSCSMRDECPEISLRINYLEHTIDAHETWDRQHPMVDYPDGRHAGEISELRRALDECKKIAMTKCRNQPQWIPAEQPEEDRQQTWEAVKRQIEAALPYALAAVAIGIVAACFLTGVCEAAIAAALAAVLTEEALAAVLAILAGAGTAVAR